jgi:hypothetical protein
MRAPYDLGYPDRGIADSLATRYVGKRTRAKARAERRPQASSSPGTAKAGYELKVERALEHLNALDSLSNRWLKRDAYALIEHDEPNTGGKILSVRPKQSTPTDLSLLIGDCIHNLRSSLDVLAHDLAWRGAAGPITQRTDRGSAFPVWIKTPSQGDIRKRIGTIDPTAQAIIQDLQPHDGGENFVSNDLWLLDELWNFDKHRRLHVTLFAVVSYGIGRSGESFDAEWIETLGGGPIRRETPLLRYKVTPHSVPIQGVMVRRASVMGPVGRGALG